MLRNYFVIAIRNLVKHKSFSLINILGLSLGVACCLLLALYVYDEVGYDKHHDRTEDLYRIITHIQGVEGFANHPYCSPPIAMALRDDIPEIETATRLIGRSELSLIRHEDNVFYERNGFVADSTLFDVFSYSFTEGFPAKALTDPNTIVITESLAKKLFKDEPALGKVISISQGQPFTDYKITGVFRPNAKSFIAPNFITSMMGSGLGDYIHSDEAQGEWAGQNFVPSYVKITPGHAAGDVSKKMNEVLVKYGAEDMRALGISKTLSLEPVQNIYLKSVADRTPRIVYIYIIACIAVFILALACINFMNLSTAKATKRASEIGIRKTMGAFRSSLVAQILGEAIVLVFIAVVLSVILVQLALPFFNQLTGKTIAFSADNAGYFAAALIVIIVVTGLLAGSYPAFYLSSFQPAQVLKGKINTTSGWLRQSLVVFQFTIAIALVCGMFIISKQLKYIENQNLGFNPNTKVVLPLRTGSAKKSFQSLKQELSRVPHVNGVSAVDYLPGSGTFNDLVLYTQGSDMEHAIYHKMNPVDHGFVELLEIPIIAGRTFSDNYELESQNKIIINRASADAFGFTPQEALGQEVYFDWQGQTLTFTVIGVMEDYHQSSLKDRILPSVYRVFGRDYNFDYAIAAIESNDVAGTLKAIKIAWENLITDTPFEFSFLDENIQKQYAEDRRASGIIMSFTVIAMLISCLGLYGLSTYMAERRFKEIGVRKVMGASVGQIVGLMSKEFVKLVIVAFIIAGPLAWYAMSKWLEGFAYKMTMDVMLFVYAGIAALAVALLTVSFESVKAASTNPVNALRSE